jgi:ferritin
MATKYNPRMRIQKSMTRAIKKLPYLREVFLERDQLRSQLSQLEFPPGHYSSPHPCIEEIRRKEAEIFERVPRTIPAIDLNEEQQMALFQKFKEYYKEQPFDVHKKAGVRYFFENSAYGSHDAIVLYYFIRHICPKRIIEVGSGYSSCVILDTNELFFGNRISCTFIDPNPGAVLSLITESDRTSIQIIRSNVQDVGLNLFLDLAPGDILLIDSSHVAKINSDVNYIFFEVLPRIRSGVYVHFHDIRFPFEYWKEWVYAGRAWNEAYLLRAFLQYNSAFKIQYFNSFLAQFHKDELAKEMPLCMKDTGGSIWIKKVSNPA